MSTEPNHDSQGFIWYHYLGTKTIIQTGNVEYDYESANLLPNQNPRVMSQWRAALKELKDVGLVEDEGNGGEVFLITPRGYEVADMIEEIN